MEKAYFNWSSGKDSSLALYYSLKSNDFKVETLFSVIVSDKEKISMHEIGIDLLKKQANEIGIPLTLFWLDETWTPKEYEVAMKECVEKFKEQGITTALFGDIYLEELRNRRVENCSMSGIKAEFPLWNSSPKDLMRQFVRSGFKAIITCIDNAVLPESFLGKIIDEEFIETYPKNADICGENGEYHSFVFDGPIFEHSVDYKIVRKYYRDYNEGETNSLHRYYYLELE